MGKQCDLELIKDYVNGDITDNLQIENLENDVQFMKDVINYTNDKKMYNLCSEKVKLNYDFVNFLYKKFYYDKKFIYNVLLYYTDKLKSDSPQYIDVILKLRDISKEIDENVFVSCGAKLQTVYFDFRIGSEYIKNYPKDKKDIEIINNSKMGFLILLEAYIGYKNLINYFAYLYVDEIFNNSGLQLEKIAHKTFFNKSDLEKYGINRFVIDIISNYDKELANYVSKHKEVLEDIINYSIKRIIRNWDWFVKNNEKIRYEIIFEETDKIMEEYRDYCSFGTDEILYYIAKKLGIEKELLKHDRLTDDEYNNIEKLIDLDISKRDFKMVEVLVYNKIKKMIINILSQRVVEEVEEDYLDDKNCHKILNADFNNKLKLRR